MKPISLPPAPDARDYNALDPLDSRYYDPEISQYLSERSRIAYQAYVEAALARTLAAFGVCSNEIAEQIVTATTTVTAEAVYAAELTTKHDIKALVNVIKSQLPEAAQPYVHFGATSYDIVATASALQLRGAMQAVVLPRLKALIETLLGLSEQYKATVQIGRTHGQHAVPITFGFALVAYVERLGSSYASLEQLTDNLHGKFSGAVGAYNALSLFVDDPFAFEKQLLESLTLQPAPYSNQIVPAEATIRLLDELAIAAGIMANLSHDMRHLQRSEIAEVRERFEPGQTGSSTMAHKRNPWNFENVISMSKQVTGQMLNANLNITSEHQRDLTDSASSRFYGVAIASVASMTNRLNTIMGKLEVDEAAMQKNLGLSGGAIAAEPLYLLLEKYGHTEAHEAAKELAHQAIDQGVTLYEVASTNEALADYWKQLTDAERAIVEHPETHYTGLAEQRTQLLIDSWRQRL